MCNQIPVVFVIFGAGKGTGGDKQNTSRTEEPDVKEKVKQLMEMSQRPEDDVCLVLHECDYDLNLACNKLLEAETQVSVKYVTVERNSFRLNVKVEVKNRLNFHRASISSAG